MAGVKKSGGKRAGRTTRTARTKGTKGTKGTKATTKLNFTKGTKGSTKDTKERSPGRKTGSERATTKGATAPRVPAGKRHQTRTAPERTIVRIRELDPYRKCGPGTSVERLIRVDEEVAGRKEAHLVYYDRHGWYCEHGRTCHAVKHARKGVQATR